MLKTTQLRITQNYNPIHRIDNTGLIDINLKHVFQYLNLKKRLVGKSIGAPISYILKFVLLIVISLKILNGNYQGI